ncbi:acetyltransferase [Sporomusaceae bacterium FL31]|nr:acetyltransferase [Sporomusaceae bacterium FL31]GCE32603.1 acetyltransferase [Sporomusaceae bacterium]
MKKFIVGLLTDQQKQTIKRFYFYIMNRIRGSNFLINGANNDIVTNNSFLKKTKIEIVGNNNFIIIKNNVRLEYAKIRLIGNNQCLEIGDNCSLIGQKNSIELISLEGNNCKIIIGENTTIEHGARIAAIEDNSKIIIGNDCMFSIDIGMRTTDFHSIIDLETGKRSNPARDIIIGNHVWLGMHVNVLKGVYIADDSVVGVRSLVACDVSGKCIVAGIPARVVKNNTTWKRELV